MRASFNDCPFSDGMLKRSARIQSRVHEAFELLKGIGFDSHKRSTTAFFQWVYSPSTQNEHFVVRTKCATTLRRRDSRRRSVAAHCRNPLAQINWYRESQKGTQLDSWIFALSIAVRSYDCPECKKRCPQANNASKPTWRQIDTMGDRAGLSLGLLRNG